MPDMGAPVKEFVRCLEKIDRSKHSTDVFRDFTHMAFCALSKRATPCPTKAAQIEAAYMQTVATYRDPEDVRRMPELLAIATTALTAGGCDFLGEVAGEIGALDGKLGQFFTPYEVSRLIVEMTLADAPALIERQGFITIQEPAAGAGGMILAAADVLTSKGIDLARQVWFEAVELNRSTYHMAYIQTALRGVAGRVVNGNSLSLEVFGSAYTHAAWTFIDANGDPFRKQKAAVAQEQAHRPEPSRPAPQPQPYAPAIQLSLFD